MPSPCQEENVQRFHILLPNKIYQFRPDNSFQNLLCNNETKTQRQTIHVGPHIHLRAVMRLARVPRCITLSRMQRAAVSPGIGAWIATRTRIALSGRVSKPSSNNVDRRAP